MQPWSFTSPNFCPSSEDIFASRPDFYFDGRAACGQWDIAFGAVGRRGPRHRQQGFIRPRGCDQTHAERHAVTALNFGEDTDGSETIGDPRPRVEQLHGLPQKKTASEEAVFFLLWKANYQREGLRP